MLTTAKIRHIEKSILLYLKNNKEANDTDLSNYICCSVNEVIVCAFTLINLSKIERFEKEGVRTYRLNDVQKEEAETEI